MTIAKLGALDQQAVFVRYSFTFVTGKVEEAEIDFSSADEPSPFPIETGWRISLHR
jgi:hypothetical protein